MKALKIKQNELTVYWWQFYQLLDIVMDGYNQKSKYNPIVNFLSDVTGYSLIDVSDCFRYYRAFGNFSCTPFTQVIINAPEGSDFWWQLYNSYDRIHLEESYEKMFKILVNHIY